MVNTDTHNIYTGRFCFSFTFFNTYGGMKTTLYGNFILYKFKFRKKLQRFEFICEKPIFAVKSLFLFLQKSHENWLRGVISCALHSGAYKSSKNKMCFEMQKVKVRVKFNILLHVRISQIKHMFRKIKSRSFICCSQSLKNN